MLAAEVKNATRSYQIVGLLLGVLAIAPRLLFTMQMDQYFHHYLGWRLLHGGLPYVGSFDQNFPGGAVLYAVAILLFGHSSLGFAFFDFLAQGYCCYLLTRLAARYDKSGVASLLAPLFYGLIYIGLGVWDTGQRDSFIAPMLLVFLSILLKDHIRTQGWIGAGLLVGMMTLTRPMFVLASLLIFWRWLEDKQSTRWSNQHWMSLLYSTVGAIALPAITVLVYLVTGHLQELYDATIAFNVEVYSKFRHGVNFRGSGSMTIVTLIGIVLLIVCSREQWREKLLLFVAAAIAPVSTYIQGQGDSHHLTPSYAVAALLAALGFAAMLDFLRARILMFRARYAVIACASVVIIATLARAADRLPITYIKDWSAGVPLRDIYLKQRAGDVDLHDEFAVSEYVRRKTSSSDYINIFSMRIWPYELADRLPPGRFQAPEHLIMQPEDQPVSPVQRKWRAEYMHDLNAHVPKEILITTTDQLWLYPHAEASIDQLKRFPEFDSFLQARYALDTVIGAFNIYGLKK